MEMSSFSEDDPEESLWAQLRHHAIGPELNEISKIIGVRIIETNKVY